MGADNECPMPDIILLNGGHHDVQSGTGSCDDACQKVFADNLRQFLMFVRTQYKRVGHMTIRVFWKGTLLTAKDLAYGFKKNKGALFLLDKQAQMITKEFGIPYINASDVIQYIPRFQEEGKGYGIYTKDRIHHGSIARAHDALKIGTVSMLITQRTLAAMCPNLGGGPSSPPMPRTSVPSPEGPVGSSSSSSSSSSSISDNSKGSTENPSPTYDSSHGIPSGNAFGSNNDASSSSSGFSFKDSSRGSSSSNSNSGFGGSPASGPSSSISSGGFGSSSNFGSNSMQQQQQQGGGGGFGSSSGSSSSTSQDNSNSYSNGNRNDNRMQGLYQPNMNTGGGMQQGNAMYGNNGGYSGAGSIQGQGYANTGTGYGGYNGGMNMNQGQGQTM